jgi:hypothetical protein
MKSKFSFAGYLPVILGFALAVLMAGFIVLVVNKMMSPPDLRSLPLILILSFTLVWLFWGEFRTKMIKIAINGDIISVNRFGGLGKTRTYLLSEFDGFKTSRQSYGARGILEYLYLMNGGQKTIKLSEAYHKNYQDLKAAIQPKVKDLGYEQFSFLDELKEIFV